MSFEKTYKELINLYNKGLYNEVIKEIDNFQNIKIFSPKLKNFKGLTYLALEDFKKAIQSHASAVGAGSLFVYHGPRNAVLINYPNSKEIYSEDVNNIPHPKLKYDGTIMNMSVKNILENTASSTITVISDLINEKNRNYKNILKILDRDNRKMYLGIFIIFFSIIIYLFFS